MRDQEYPLWSCLTTLVRRTETEVETHYKEAHAVIRPIAEWCIGLLKMWICCLHRFGGALQYSSIPRGSRIMVVCYALHSLAQQQVDLLEEEEDQGDTAEQEEGARRMWRKRQRRSWKMEDRWCQGSSRTGR